MYENLKFERISSGTDDVDGGIIYKIVQDSKGFFWIGCTKGLAKYDGTKFKLFKHDKYDSKSIPEGYIRNMYESEPGRITILTDSIKLFQFHLSEEKFEIQDTPFLSNDLGVVMVEDNSGSIWIGTTDNGLYRRDANKKEYVQFDINTHKEGETVNCNFITCLYYDSKPNILYIGTDTGGVNVYDVRSEKFSYLRLTNTEISYRIKCIFKDSKNNFWFGTTNGLFVYSSEHDTTKKFNFEASSESSISHDLVHCICEDKSGIIWIGTEKGLNRFEENCFIRYLYDKNDSKSIFYDTIKTLFCDDNNVLFFGTHGGGIGKVDLNTTKFHNLNIESPDPGNTTSNHISQIFKDKQNNLWVGTYRGGFYKCIPKDTWKYETVEIKGLEGVQITGITQDTYHNIWISCNKKSLSYIECNSDELHFIDENVFSEYMGIQYQYVFSQCFDRLNPDLLWVSVNHKLLILFDTVSKTIIDKEDVRKSFYDLNITCLFTDSNCNLWIGTRNKGLFKYNVISNDIINYSEGEDNRTLSDNNVTSITEDFEGNIWTGTWNGGVNKLNVEEDKFERITIKDGLPGSSISGILFDDNRNLWIASSVALSKYNTVTKEIINFTKSGTISLDGYNVHACHKSYDGILFLGTVYGVIYFRPEEIRTNPRVPDIVFTDFQIFYESVKPSPESPFLKKSISYAKEITLSYKENVITFEFASLIYNDPKQNQHAYKMEGFDEDWVYCGTRRSATYTNLDPGEYTFRVKGSNEVGLWNEEGTSIKLKISPPWHKTLLFKGLIGLGALAGLGSFYRKRISRLNEENIQREDFTKKLIESQENERKRVAAELHDSIGQDLLILKNKLLTNIKKTGDEKFIQQLSELSELTSSAIDDVRQISYNLRPYELDRLGLTKTIESMIERANNFTDITFTGILDDIDKMFPPETGINIYRIIQESLNNVIKHSGAGKVIVRVKKHGSYIYLSISDNGKGFDMRSHRLKSERNGFGLKGIEERVKLLGGEFDIDSELGKGTLIEIVIPYTTET